MSLIWVHKMTLSENVSVRLSRVRLFVSAWTIACQAPLSMEFSRQEYWNGFPFPSPGDLPDPGIESGSLKLQADSLPSEPPGKPKAGFGWVISTSQNLRFLFCKWCVSVPGGGRVWHGEQHQGTVTPSYSFLPFLFW